MGLIGAKNTSSIDFVCPLTVVLEDGTGIGLQTQSQ